MCMDLLVCMGATMLPLFTFGPGHPCEHRCVTPAWSNISYCCVTRQPKATWRRNSVIGPFDDSLLQSSVHSRRIPYWGVLYESETKRKPEEHLRWWPSLSVSNLVIRSSVCLTTGPLFLLQQVLHTVRSSASSFNWQYPFFSSRSPSSCLRLLHCLLSFPLSFIQ